ncbi:hypothetical protein ACQKWADRAFT_316930 [Trichoderma austrokoningii]
MEIGELDFNSLLWNRLSGTGVPAHSFDITFVRYYWKEIHAQAVVYSDLKPVNFVLVKSWLELVGFGIANAIQTDVTINIHQPHRKSPYITTLSRFKVSASSALSSMMTSGIISAQGYERACSALGGPFDDNPVEEFLEAVQPGG